MKDMTWFSFVDKHTGENLGIMLLDGHVDVDSMEITGSATPDTADSDDGNACLEFLRTAERGRVYTREELPFKCHNSDGEPR